MEPISGCFWTTYMPVPVPWSGFGELHSNFEPSIKGRLLPLKKSQKSRVLKGQFFPSATYFTTQNGAEAEDEHQNKWREQRVLDAKRVESNRGIKTAQYS
jgi:hypothetical protein